jgi:hypothetical protein
MLTNFGHDGARLAFEFAFPDRYYAPTPVCQLFYDSLVARNGSIKLRKPEVAMRAGCRGVSAPHMAVPEAAVNENNSPVSP